MKTALMFNGSIQDFLAFVSVCSMAVRGCFRADANSCCESLPEQEDGADINISKQTMLHVVQHSCHQNI